MRVVPEVSVTFGQAAYRPRSELELVAHAPGAPGARIEVLWRAESLTPSAPRALEEHVVHAAVADRTGELLVRCTLPRTPLTYEGRVLRISWLVRVLPASGDPQEFPFVVA